MRKQSVLDVLSGRYPDKDRKYFYSRIMCGEVIVDGEKIVDPNRQVKPDSVISFNTRKYVSRGGYKLEAALEYWDINPEGLVFLDAGSSTGGFTDCLLQGGASHVHAVDVGYNQLAYSLRNDPRVSVHEKQNIMTLQSVDPPADMAVADLSFRSISGAASHITGLTRLKKLIALIKPQFEIDPVRHPEFSGIVEGRELFSELLVEILVKIRAEGLYVDDIIISPVKGRKGNTEFLFLIEDNNKPFKADLTLRIAELVSSVS